MLRAILVSIGGGLLLLWLVGLVDGSTWWMTWLDGVAAVLAIGYAALVTDATGPVGASIGSLFLGMGLAVLFIVGLITHASGWLTWFTGAFAAGLLSEAAFAFTLRAFEPQLSSRRPEAAM